MTLPFLMRGNGAEGISTALAQFKRTGNWVIPEEETFDGFVGVQVSRLDFNGQLMAMESYAGDLQRLRSDLVSTGKLTANLAMEADSLMADTGLVRAFYSAEPSEKKFQVALESLDRTIWVLVIAAVAALTALIMKALDHFSGGSSGSSGGGSFSPNADMLEATQERNAKFMKSLAVQQEAVRAAIDPGLKALDRVIEHANSITNTSTAQRSLESHVASLSVLQVGIIHHTQHVEGIKKYMNFSINGPESNTSAFTKLRQDVEGGETWFRTAIAQARAVKDEAELKAFKESDVLSKLKFETGALPEKLRSLAGDMSYDLSNHSHDKWKGLTKLNLTQIHENYAKVGRDLPMVAYAKNWERWVQELGELKTSAEEIETSVKKLRDNADITTIGGSAEKFIIDEYHKYVMYEVTLLRDQLKAMAQASAFIRAYQELGPKLEAITLALMEFLAEEAKKNGKADVAESLRDAKKELKQDTAA